MPLTMAPKLDKVMAAKWVLAVRTMDQSLACQLMLDVVGLLTDLLEKISKSSPTYGEEEEGIDLQLVEDSVQSALAFLENAATQ